MPVIVGSLGRIPVGALTDRFGGRVMFPALSLITIAPVLYLGFFGRSSLASLLVGGFFLGVAGTVFAVGVPFVSAWFPPERRGLALGVFGAGMGGTAITALTTIPLVDARGIAFPFELMAVVLAGYAVAAWLVLQEAPSHARRAARQAARGDAEAAGDWQMSALYAVVFSGRGVLGTCTYLKGGTTCRRRTRRAGWPGSWCWRWRCARSAVAVRPAAGCGSWSRRCW